MVQKSLKMERNLMDDSLKNTYHYAYMITKIKRTIELGRKNDAHGFSSIWNDIKEDIVAFCKIITSLDYKLGSCIWNNLEKCTGYQLLELSDELEQMIPLFYQAINRIGHNHFETGELAFKCSSSGFLSLSKEDNLLCSEIDPMWEAYLLANTLYEPQMTIFCSIGCSMGYLPYQIYSLSSETIDIYIIERDISYIEIAMKYGVLSWIPDEHLHFYIGEPIEMLDFYATLLESHSDEIISYFEEFRISEFDVDTNNIFTNLRMNSNTERFFGEISSINFYNNIKNVNEILTSKLTSDNREWLVIAAGPSLDDYIEEIASDYKKYSIICVGTVLKKLLKRGIIPDYVAILDPTEYVYRQIEGISNFEATLLIGPTTNWKIAANYYGKKYLLPGRCIAREKDFFKNKGIEQYELGSTVSYMAILSAIKISDCKTINIVGLDLSYPTDKSHANDTADNHSVNTEKMVEVRSMSGNPVKTTPQFMKYITEIEDLLSINSNINYINWSNNGAYITGTKLRK